MSDAAEPVRLAVLAALIALEYGDSIGPLTIDEAKLAPAIRGAMTRADARAIAALLRLAANSPLAPALRISLRETFLDDDPADHAAAFCAIYWQLGVPGLSDDAKEQAAQLLSAVSSRSAISVTAHSRLTEGLQRAFDTFLTRCGENAMDEELEPLSGDVLAKLLWEDVGDWFALARSAARDNGDAWRLEQWDTVSADSIVSLDDVALLLLSCAGHQDPPAAVDLARWVAREGPVNTAALARRVAGQMAGPPAPLWQYIAVNIVPAFAVELFDGWELVPVDLARDDKAPLYYPLFDFCLERYHVEEGYGAIRRCSSDRDAPDEGSGNDDPVLLWQLITLNLYSEYPVHAGISYYVEEGRQIVPYPRADHVGADPLSLTFTPMELNRWDDSGSELERPRKMRTIDAAASSRLRAFASQFGARLAQVPDRQRASFARAAEQYLFVVERTPVEDPPAVPTMHAPEATFRWVSAIEGLLSDNDDRSDLKRKTAQRAAVLVGKNDDDRRAARDLVNAAYNVRSAYAHGSKPGVVNLSALRSLTRRVMVSWLVLAAEYPAKAFPGVLDDALLSGQALEDGIQRPLRRFWDHVAPSKHSP